MPEKHDKKELKKLIKKQIERTKEKITELKELTQPISPENAIGRVSRMDAINNKSINDAALLKAKEKLRKLEYAFDRIEDENFGTCAKCGNQIQAGRILLMPESNYCVRCASR